MSQLQDILDACIEALVRIDGTGDFETDIGGRVYKGLKEVRTEAAGESYIEITEGLPGRRRLSQQQMGSGLSDTVAMRLMCWVTSQAVLDDTGLTDEDSATEQARLLEEDIRRAMYDRQQLPLAGDEQAYYVAWVETEPIGLYLDELGRVLFTVQFDIIYAATVFA